MRHYSSTPRRAESALDRYNREQRTLEREDKSLRDAGWEFSSPEKLRAATLDQLFAAVKLRGQPGVLGYVAEQSAQEIHRRTGKRP